MFLHLAKTGGRTVDTQAAQHVRAGLQAGGAAAAPSGVGLDDGEFVAPVYGPDELPARRRCPGCARSAPHISAPWSGFHATEPVRYVILPARAAGPGRLALSVPPGATTLEPLGWDRWCAWPEHHDHQVRRFDRDGDPARAIAAIEAQGVFVGLLERFEESLPRGDWPRPSCAWPTAAANTAGEQCRGPRPACRPGPAASSCGRCTGEFPLYEWSWRAVWPRYEAAYGSGLMADGPGCERIPSGFRRWPDLLGRVQHRFWIAPWWPCERRG
ncbi:MAG: hypothetical protein R3D98_17510 [Candidatus Krumholzibacteriia bacterium]